jgi:kinesin family protein C2/C3
MEGGEGIDRGISFRTIEKLFNITNYRTMQHAASQRKYEEGQRRVGGNTDMGTGGEFKFSINVGMLEIYNDAVYDLLVSTDKKAIGKKKKQSLEIKRNKEGHIEVAGLTKEPVKSLKDVLLLLKRGNKSRATAETDLNAHSSRSHMVLSVQITSGIEGGDLTTGNLYLVDLAGSERVRKSAVEGQGLKEASHINKSLAALGNVMEALDRKASHVPYRDSKLTYLLQDSLGGNSRTMMVVAVCPASNSFDETQHALQFATRVRRINIGSAKKNVASKNLEQTVKALSSELKMLAKAKERSEEQLVSLKRDHNRIQDRLRSSSENRAKANDEARTLTVLKSSNAQMTARWQKEKQMHEKAAAELDDVNNDVSFRTSHKYFTVGDL